MGRPRPQRKLAALCRSRPACREVASAGRDRSFRFCHLCGRCAACPSQRVACLRSVV